jgi:type II secretory pathway component PulC
MWWVPLLGCATQSKVAELEVAVTELESQRRDAETRLAALEAKAAREATAAQEAPEPTAALDPGLTPRQVLADPAAAVRLGRLAPHRGPDGELDGYRVSAIRHGSLADRVGVRNGDILYRVNGVSVVSVEEMNAAYAKVTDPTVTVLTLTVTRAGTQMELRIPLDEVPPPYVPDDGATPPVEEGGPR